MGIIDLIIQAESGGNPNAVSPVGAMGLMQVMPDTARSPGFGVNPLKNPFDPEENRRFGTEYFNAMLKRYGGDNQRALVAYNWGPGNADKWNGDLGSLPAETRDYVQKIEAGLAKPEGAMRRTAPQRPPALQGTLPPALRERPSIPQPGPQMGLLDMVRDGPSRRAAISPQQEDSGFTGDDLGSVFDALATGFNTMRWRPDPGINRQVAQRTARREAKSARNQTAEFMRKSGAGPLADLVESGGLSARDAMTFMLATPEDTRTSLMKNFEYFVAQGMDPAEAIKAVKGGTNVNVNTGRKDAEYGAPPKDSAWARDGAGNIVTEEMPGRPGMRRPVSLPIGGTLADQTARDVSNQQVGAVENASQMLATIDGALKDPALDTATGLLSWTQAVPGTDAYRFGTRVQQMQGQVFLQAFERLKGAGQITEIEGAKAQQAIARLQPGQRPEDFRTALGELREIVSRAQSRAKASLDGQAENLSDEDFLRKYGLE